jgi:hypothetical protein
MEFRGTASENAKTARLRRVAVSVRMPPKAPGTRQKNTDMSIAQLTKVAGLEYRWWFLDRTNEFPALALPLIEYQAVSVVRIVSLDARFDIAMRMNRGEYAGGVVRCWLGPLLVLNPAFAGPHRHMEPNTRIRLRPKLSVLRAEAVDEAVVQRVIQWCLSSRFRAVKCNVWGS